MIVKRAKKIFVIFVLIWGWIIPTHSTVTAEENSTGLDFQSALSEILRRSTSIRIQESRKQSVEAQNLPASLRFLPTVTVQDAYYREKRFFQPTQRGKLIGLTSTWNLFQFGADWAEWRATHFDKEQSQSLVDNQVLAEERSAAQKILNAIQFRRQVEINRKLFDSQVEAHRIARLRYEKGLLPLQEVQMVYIDMSNSEARLKDAEVQEANANAQLISALGSNNIRYEWPWQNLILNAIPNIDKNEFSLDQVPAWKAAAALKSTGDYRVSRDFRRMLPSIDFVSSYNFRGTTYSQDEWTGALTISFPIFDHLANYSKFKTQVENRTIYELSQEQVRRDAEAEWKAARDSYRTSLATAAVRNESLNLARRLFRDNERRFKDGKISANDLIVDQDRLFRAEQFALEGWNSAHLAYIRLCHALGKRIANCLQE